MNFNTCSDPNCLACRLLNTITEWQADRITEDAPKKLQMDTMNQLIGELGKTMGSVASLVEISQQHFLLTQVLGAAFHQVNYVNKANGLTNPQTVVRVFEISTGEDGLFEIGPHGRTEKDTLQ